MTNITQQIIYSITKNINFLLYVLICYSGLLIGLLISNNTKEELKKGLKIFIILKTIIFLTIIEIFIIKILNQKINNHPNMLFYIMIIISIIINLIIFLLYLLRINKKKNSKKFIDIINKDITNNIEKIILINKFLYVLYAIILYELSLEEITILITILIFIYGLFYSPIIIYDIKEIKNIEKIKIVLKENFIFIITAFLLILINK